MNYESKNNTKGKMEPSMKEYADIMLSEEKKEPKKTKKEHTSKRLKIIGVVSVILLLTSVTVNVFQISNYNSLKNDYAELEENRNNYRDLLGEEIEGANSSHQIRVAYEYCLDYLINNAVEVSSTDNHYHKACCEYIKDTNTQLYIIGDAKNRGYTPCELCFANEYVWQDHIVFTKKWL